MNISIKKHLFLEPLFVFLSVIMVTYFINGRGIDFRAVYHGSNLLRGGLNDFVGFYLATLTISDTHIGVQILSIILSVSLIMLFRYSLGDNYHSLNTVTVLVILLLMFLSWPIILGNLNVMRQGWLMALIFLYITYFSSSAFIIKVLLLIFMMTLHNSALLFVPLITAAEAFYKYQRLLPKRLRMLALIITLFIIALTVYYGYQNIKNADLYKVIGKDISVFLLLMNLTVILYLLFHAKRLDRMRTYMLFFNSIIPVFFFSGALWQFERLNMVIIVANIMMFVRGVKEDQRPLTLFLIYSIFVALTFWVGIYSSFE